MILDVLYVSWNRRAYTAASFEALLANTDWSRVRQLVIADDVSEDGAREWLDLARLQAPVPSVFIPAPFGGPVAAANRYLDWSADAPAEAFAKIDNDTVLPPGWLPELLGLLERHPDVDLLGVRADLGPPRECPYAYRGVKYAPFVDGNGVWRRRAFEGRRRPIASRRERGRHGMTQWQQAHPEVVKAWASPDIPVFQLDNLPLAPWRALGAEYAAKGWQRGWPNALYRADAYEYWDWWAEARAAIGSPA